MVATQCFRLVQFNKLGCMRMKKSHRVALTLDLDEESLAIRFNKQVTRVLLQFGTELTIMSDFERTT